MDPRRPSSAAAGRGTRPSSRFERKLRSNGFPHVAGTDEVGRGCLAGPVVAAAVILKEGASIPGLRDSKLLLPRQRRVLVPRILRASIGWGIGAVSPAGIDRHNIRIASFRAMRIALRRLDPAPDHVIVDGFVIPGMRLPQIALIKGDRRCRSVAAASVLAKVARDRRMKRYHREWPQYGFSRNRGYGTPLHLRALEQFGPCPLHRRTFAPVRRVVEGNLILPL